MPDWTAYVRSRLEFAAIGAQREADIVAEISQQLEDAYNDALARGMTIAEAEAFAREQVTDWKELSQRLTKSRRGAPQASVRFDAAAEDALSQGGWRAVLAAVLQDFRFGVRMMRKNKGFTLAAVLTLALGIGANTTIFGVINATLLKKLPYPEPERLMVVMMTFGKDANNINIISAPDFWDWQQQNSVFERMAVFDSAGKGYNLAADDKQRETEAVSGVRVSSDFFSVLGVNPFLGRGFLKEEEIAGKDHVVVLSYGLWQRRYAGDRDLVGRQIRMDGEPYTVVGIMPPGFSFQFDSGPRELWVPAAWTPGDRSRGSRSFFGIGRLKPGVTVEQAHANLSPIQQRNAKTYEEDADSDVRVIPAEEFDLRTVQRISLALLAAVAFVLLIGCVNVANLMLARGAERRRELAIRRALGASAGRIMRQMLAESVVLAMVGGCVGLAVAYWGQLLLKRVLPPAFRYLPMRPFESVSLDARVLAFTFAITCVTAIVFGVVPALTAVRGDIQDPLKEGARGSTQGGRHKLRHALVASEVALALILLTAAGLMIKSMARLTAVDPGFNPSNVLVTSLSLPQKDLYYGPPSHGRFCQELSERVGTIPGVVAASAAAHLPLAGRAGRDFYIEGRPVPEPRDEPGGVYTVTCPDYFRAMGIPLVRGRDFTHEDRQGSTPVVIISEAMVQKYWHGEDPLGKRIEIDHENHVWMTIVGIVGDTRQVGLDRDAIRQLYRPYTQAGWPWMQVVVRTQGAPAGYTRAVKQAMASVEPDRGISDFATMEDVVRRSTGSRRFPMQLLACFSGLALVLAAVGIVGMVSYSVTQRTNEIGIRIALGAKARDVLQLIVGGSMAWVLGGVAVGVAASVGVARMLSAMLFEVKPADPAVLGAVALLLSVVAFGASLGCALRATRVDPLVALRSE